MKIFLLIASGLFFSLQISSWLIADKPARTTEPISIVDEKRFNAVDRGGYQLVEEIGKIVSISTPIER